MDIFTLSITEQDRILTLTSDASELGSQYDNRAQKLVFLRPEGRQNDNLLLLFETQSQEFEPVDIGQENEFIVTNALTQSAGLKLQAVFARDNQLEHSNSVFFTLRPSLRKGEAPVEPWPDPVRDMTEKAFAGVAYEDNVLSFRNLAGDELANVTVEGGGGGGTSTIAWLPEVSAAGEISWKRSSTTTAPATANITGPAGPQGAQGAQGTPGTQGTQGPKGDTGSTGAQGPKGDTGAAGAQGPKGDTGSAGAQGPKGDTGAAGAQGPQGNPTTVNGKTGASITLTAADVGAAASADVAARLPFSGGTMTGQLIAQGNTAYGTSQVRNTVISMTDLTAGSSALASGSLYFVYE